MCGPSFSGSQHLILCLRVKDGKGLPLPEVDRAAMVEDPGSGAMGLPTMSWVQLWLPGWNAMLARVEAYAEWVWCSLVRSTWSPQMLVWVWQLAFYLSTPRYGGGIREAFTLGPLGGPVAPPEGVWPMEAP